MNNDTVFLTLEQILALHEDLIERYRGSYGIRELNLLESAIFRSQVTFGGNELYETLFDKAAVIMHSLILNHPFLDGNKRTGTISALQFLSENSIEIFASQEEILVLALNIESKKLNVKQIAQWLEKHVEK